MNAIAIDYAVSGVLLAIYSESPNDQIRRFTIHSLSNDLQNRVAPEFDLERTEKIIRAIEKMNLGRYYQDPFADPVFEISEKHIRDFFIKRQEADDIFARSWNLGFDWLKTALVKPELWSEFDKEDEILVVLLTPPHSGTFPLDHNSGAFQEASHALDALANAIEKGNDVGSLTEEELEAAKGEIAEIKGELSQGAVTLPDFAVKVRTTMAWIAKKAAEALIGGLAIAALQAILRLFDIPF